MSKNNGIKVKQLLEVMKSGNEIVFSKAIVELNGLMKPELLPELVSILQSIESDKNRYELIQFFNDFFVIK